MKARLLLLVVILSAFVIEPRSAHGQQPAQPEKTVKFTVEGKPWPEVFEWLTEVTGKPVISVYKPTGKFPRLDLPDKEYTIPQVVDIINAVLQSDNQKEKFYLINRERSFTLIPADEQLEPWRVPRVKYESLVNYGRFETVSLVLPLQRLDAGKMATLVNVMLGPKGSVYAMTAGGFNYLILIDRADKLKRIGLFLLVLDTAIDPFSHLPRLQR